VLPAGGLGSALGTFTIALNEPGTIRYRGESDLAAYGLSIGSDFRD